jgi:type 2 lantibiotic biosynthesis protein LanM
MEWSEEEWFSLAAKAAFLHERRASSYVPAVVTSEMMKQVENRMLRWKKNVANGNDSLFQRRLEWDNLSSATAANLLQITQFAGTELPPWTKCLREVMHTFPAMAERPLAGNPSYAPFLNAQPVAFEHLMVPFVEYASKSVLANRLSGELLEKSALVDLQRFLLTQLCQCAISCLMVEFSAFRAVRGSKAGGTGETGNGSEAKDGPDPASIPSLYYAFLQRMWNGKYAEFLQSYSVLARRLAEYTGMWSRFVIEFLERLHADLPDLQELFHDPSLRKIVRIESGLSDRHNHGRVVLSLQASSGQCIVYKPKDLGTERAYHRLLQWLNQRHLLLWPQELQCLCRDGYGWVAALKPFACNTAEEVQKFYYRAGSLLGLFHAIGGNDIHGENLLACGDYPALIDAETLLSPELRPLSGGETASGLTTKDFWDWSVFRTAMLPRWIADQASGVDTVSGLADTDSAPPLFTRMCEFPNTDRMAIVTKQLPGRELRNVPRLNGRAVAAGEHIADIVSGFRDMYGFLMTNKQAILAPDGPLEYFANLPMRWVFRNTYIYSTLISKLQRPEFLRDGTEASFLAEALYKFLLHGEAKSPMWQPVSAEIEAVLRGDIPIFHYQSTSDLLEFEGQSEQVKCFVQPAYEAMKARFQRLGEADRELQICYIRSAFKYSVAILQEEQEENEVGPLTLPESASSPTWQEAAVAIATEIRKAVRLGKDDTATWVSRSFDPVEHTWKLRPMDSRFYDGITGTAVFLAALEKVAETSDFHDLLVGALNTIKTVAPTLKRQSDSAQFCIGAGIGLTSICYGLAKIADFLQMEEALVLARTYMRYLTLDKIQSDTNFDLMSGAAGSILVLLAMHKLTGDQSLHDMAAECGYHLLRNRSVSDTGLRSWKTSQSKMLAGYSHGAAGIAHALTELFRVTSFEPFREAAIEACSFENTLFSKQRGNWANMSRLTGEGTPEFWNTWCHGAVGIGLGRMASCDVLGASARDDIEEALKTTLMEKFSTVDHACCGNMGSLELFLHASIRFGRNVYMEKANQIGTSVLRRARTNGHYKLGTNVSFESPSFHQGTAGIGYQFLRLAAPRTLPSVLLWQ